MGRGRNQRLQIVIAVEQRGGVWVPLAIYKHRLGLSFPFRKKKCKVHATKPHQTKHYQATFPEVPFVLLTGCSDSGTGLPSSQAAT